MNDSGLDPRSLDPSGALSDGSGELFQQVRSRIVRPGGLYFFNKAIIGFPDLSKRAHLPLCLFYEDDSLLSKLCEYPKSHLKTSCGTVGKTLHVFAKRVIAGQDPIDRVALGSSTKTNAKRFLRLVKLIPETNQIFQAFLPELIPEFDNEEAWNLEEITFPRQRKFTDPSVDTLGVGGAATSRHYTGIIEDDLLNEEDCDSPSAIKKAIELHQYYTSLLIDNTCWIITNEHSWTQFDVNKHIIDNEPDTAVFSCGATKGFNQQRSRHIPAYILQQMDDLGWGDGQSVWPERFDQEELLRRRSKTGARVFNAVFENDPFDPDVVDFKEEWIRRYEWTREGDLRIMPGPGWDMEIVPRHHLNVVGAFDPALSKKTTADRSAVVITGVDPQERIFLLEDYAMRKDPLVVLNDLMALIKKWRVTYMGVETVLFQRVLFDLLKEEGMKRGIYSGTFKELKPPRGANKEARIRALIGSAFEQGRVYIHSRHTNFIDEYLHFPIGQTVDVLDAFTYSSMLWVRGEDEDERVVMAEYENEYLAGRDAVTGY